MGGWEKLSFEKTFPRSRAARVGERWQKKIKEKCEAHGVFFILLTRPCEAWKWGGEEKRKSKTQERSRKRSFMPEEKDNTEGVSRTSLPEGKDETFVSVNDEIINKIYSLLNGLSHSKAMQILNVATVNLGNKSLVTI